jgi:glycosyltransferase involved in cell wall biosynthesis
MKICFICPEYPPGRHGGVGTFTQVLGRALAHAGHDVRSIGVYPPDYEAPDYQDDEGVKVWRLREPTYPLGWVVARYQMYSQVARWVRAGEVELVEAPDSRGWFAGWPAISAPLIIRANGSFSYFARELNKRLDALTFRLERWTFRRADAWASVSQHTGRVTQEVFDLPAGPDAILHNPVKIPPTVAPFAQRRPNQVIFTGTLTAKKGIISLIDSWPKVKQRFDDAELYVFGKDNTTSGGQSMQSHLLSRLPAELHRSVHFCGHVSRERLFQALSEARTAVFPSYSEAFAIAPLESMACGCPTIFTKLSSGPESIRDNIDGLLVDPDNHDEIAEAILAILRDDALAERLSNAGRTVVQERFSIERMLAENEAFFQQCIEQKKQGAARA